MRNFRPFARLLRARLALAALVSIVVVAPALAAGPRLGTPRQKTLIETDHFGTFYVPQIVTTGRAVVAIWRGPNQTGTVRTFAISTDGGTTFTYKLKPVRIPVMSQLFAVAGDSEGNLYFAGTTAFPNQVAVVRTDTKLKDFTAGTLIDSDQSIVAIDMKTAPNGTLYLAYQTAYSARITNSVTTQVQQVRWAASADRGATFGEFIPTNARPSDFSEFAPSLAVGAGGEVYLLAAHDDTRARAESPDTYTGGELALTRIDTPEPQTLVVARDAASTGRVDEVRAYVAADGTLGVAWADVAVDGAEPGLQTVFFTRVAPESGTAIGSASVLGRVGSAHDFEMERTADGQVVVILFGAGHDSDQPEPALIGRASNDDGQTFGEIRQITGYPPVTSLGVATDGRRVYGLWTDTRMVRFSAFTPKPASAN
jgi:hypothetical protein